MSTRVYDLARELNISSKAIIVKLKEMGINVSYPANGLTDSEYEMARKALQGSGQDDPGTDDNKEKAAGPEKKEDEGRQKARQPKEAKSERPERSGAKKNKPDSSAQRSADNRTPQPEKKIFSHASDAASSRGEQQAKGDKKHTDKPENKKRGALTAGDRARSRKPTDKGTPKRSDEKSDNRQRLQDGRKSGGQGHKQDAANKNKKSDRGERQEAKGGGNRSAGDRSKGSGRKSERRGGERASEKRGDKRNERSGFNNMSKPKHSRKKDPRKEQRREAARKAEEEAAAIPTGAIVVDIPITVKGLSEHIDVSISQIIMTLMRMGIMANINQNLDEDTVLILGEEFGKNIIVGNVENDEAEEGIETFEDKEEDLKPRPPIITVMGHVDHGKTSLLDKIRKTSVTESESGGITQHIGASEIVHNGQRIVFLDTPGHEAFTAMRARGAYVTDIAVLVVAADDSVKPQTVEAISHAKAANVPIIVAINKIDKPGANIDRVKQDLSEHNILVEDWGGSVISVPVSAKTGEGLDILLEMILLQAEMLELKANPSRLALGTVIEARLDKQRGPVATLLVLNGTLDTGMSIVAGNCSGRIKAMSNFKGENIRKAGPSTAVEVLGLTDVPEAGDEFNAVGSDKIARDIAENRRKKQREQVMQKTSGVTLEQLFSNIEKGEIKELNLIVKADVQGSVGALVTSLEKIESKGAAVKIVHSGVGAINESDVMLASTTGAIIIGFNVRPGAVVAGMAQRDGVEIRTYRVIYEAIGEVEAALAGMLDPEYKEDVIGSAEVRNTFRVPGVGIVAGAYVIDGKVERNAEIRVVRDGVVVHEGRISSLKRFKDDVREVSHGFECGIGVENYNDIKEGDVIEAFKMIEIKENKN